MIKYNRMESSDNNKYVEIGKRIRDLREKEGLTQADLSKYLGYTATAISLIEAGERKVKIDDLEVIAKVLHQDVNYLITGAVSQSANVGMALRAEGSLEQSDVKRIESYIELIKLQKQQRSDGTGTATK